MRNHLWFLLTIVVAVLTWMIFTMPNQHVSQNQDSKSSIVFLKSNKYHIGEDIMLTIRNPLNETIYVIGHCGMIQVEKLMNGSWKPLTTGEDRGHNELGKQVFCEEDNIVWATLRPGEIIQVNLMPMYGELMSVDEGTYRVKITYGTKCNLTIKEFTHQYVLISDELGKLVNKTEIFPVAIGCKNIFSETTPEFHIVGRNPFLEGPVSNVTGIVEYKLSKEGIL